MTLDQAIEAFRAEFPGWWWKVGECRVSCDADMALDKHDVGPNGIHPDEDLARYRTFDSSDAFSVDLPQPSTVAEALLYVMAKARVARQEFRAKSAKAREMEVRTIEDRGKNINVKYVQMSPEEWIKAEIAKRCADPARSHVT
jgi:hypothetical protein